MSDKIDKRDQDLIKRFEKLSDRIYPDFEPLLELERVLKSRKTIPTICAERYASFCDYHSVQLIPKDIILDSFKKLELQLSAVLSERYKKEINPERVWITRRSDSYFEEISNFSNLAENISNTFKWFGKDQKRNKREIIFLYQLITGSNNLKLNLLHPNVTKEDFLSLFSDQTLSSKIIWNYDLGVLIYFIGKLANEFLILPDNIEIKGTNKTSKKLWIYLNEKIIACFVDKNGNSLNRTQLNSLRNKFKTENNQSMLLIDDIISAVLIFS